MTTEFCKLYLLLSLLNSKVKLIVKDGNAGDRKKKYYFGFFGDVLSQRSWT